MRYRTKEIKQAEEAMEYLTKLIGREAVVEIKKVNPNRSLRQNAYIHLLLSAFGAHFGYTLEESKLIYKEINKDIFNYEKKGRTFTKSSADINVAEMTKSIDRFRNKSAEAGYPLPLATDQAWLDQIMNEAEQHQHYL